VLRIVGGVDRYWCTSVAMRVSSAAVTLPVSFTIAGVAGSVASTYTPSGSADPKRICRSGGTDFPSIALTIAIAPLSTNSAAASASDGLSHTPRPVLRQIPSTGTTPPSHTAHRAGPTVASAGNSTYRTVPETISVHHRPGAGTGSSMRHSP
jgi:hypothetical protein